MRVGVDLGGTKIQVVVIRRGSTVAGSARRDTPVNGGPTAVVAAMAATVRDAVEQADAALVEVSGVGIGAPGAVDPATGTVMQVANIEGLTEPFPIGAALAAELAVPVAVGNDVNVAIEAERRFGAGRGIRSFLGVFWGTGVGGGLVVDGRLLHGRGSAGEIGHVCARPGGRKCNCGLRGCVEAYAGRGALEERARASKSKTMLFDIQRKRGREKLTSGVWLRALEAGDQVAHALLDEAVEALGIGIGSAVTLLDVEAVVIGGGLGERLGATWLARIEEAARPHTFFHNAPEYRLAALGDLGGAIGASLLVR